MRISRPARRNRQVIVVLLFAATAAAAAISWPRIAAYRHGRAASDALAREDLEGAHAHLALARRQRPSDPDYAFAAAQVARRQRDYGVAEALLRAAAELGHPADEIELEEMLTAAQRGAWQRHEETLLARLAAGTPHEARIREVLAGAYYRDFLLGAALGQASAWTQIEPGSAIGWALLGDIRMRLRNRDAAADAYRRAVEANPNLVPARVGYATALLQRGQAPEAVEQFQAALLIAPRDRASRIGLIKVLLQTNQTADARKVLTGLVADFPADREVTGLAGRVELHTGRPAEAERHLRAAAEGSADWTVLNDLQQALARQGKGTEAREMQARVDRLQADLDRLDELTREVLQSLDPAPRVELGRILIRNGLRGEGAAWLRDALRTAPNDQSAHAALADHYTAIGRPDLAAEHRRFADAR
jgi:tetratricopeptide (TPR) repeat protein